LSEVRVGTASVTLLVGISRGVGLEFASYVTVTSRFVGAVGGADTRTAVVDAVPSTAVGVTGERLRVTAVFSGVAEAAVFEAGCSVPVTLVVARADGFRSVVTKHATALAFEEFTFKGVNSTFSLGVVGDTKVDLAGVAPSGPFAISVSKTFVDVGVQARTDFASVGGGVLETVGVHLGIDTQGGSVGTRAFLAARVGVSSTGLLVPTAEILGEASVFVSDKAVAGAAADVGPLVPDTGRISLAVIFLGVATDLAFTGVGSGLPFAVRASLAASLVTTVVDTGGFKAHTLGERVGVLGGALGSTFFELTVLASDTGANKCFGDFLAAHLPATGFSETVGRGGLVVGAVSVGVTEAVRKTVTRENDVGVDGSLRREDGVDVVEGVAHAVEEHGVEVINADGLEVLGRLVVDELGESDESILVGIKSSTNDVDVVTLEILDEIGVFPTDLATSDEDDGLLTVAGEFVEHSLGLVDGGVNNHEVGGVDVGAEELEFSG
jgi:hypothetical protein